MQLMTTSYKRSQNETRSWKRYQMRQKTEARCSMSRIHRFSFGCCRAKTKLHKRSSHAKADENRCSACESGLVLVDGKCEFCKVNGEFFNEDTGTCDACDASCDKCTDAGKCTKCKEGQGWLGKKNTCLPPPDGYFLQT